MDFWNCFRGQQNIIQQIKVLKKDLNESMKAFEKKVNDLLLVGWHILSVIPDYYLVIENSVSCTDPMFILVTNEVNMK